MKLFTKNEKKNNYNLFLLLLFLLLPIFSISAENDPNENSPLKPYLNGTDALKTQNFDKATKWFDITIKDFPKSEFATQSIAHNLIITLARELAFLRLIKLWEKGEKNIFEVDEGLTTRKKEEYNKKIAEYQEQNNIYKKKLLDDTLLFLKLGMVKEVSLSFSLELENWDTTTERSEVEKGVLISNDKIDKIRDGEILLNYLGLLQSLFKVTFVKEQMNPITDKTDLLVLYTALGSRLFFIGEGEKNGALYYQNAKICLNYALELSLNSLYREEREKAKEILDKIEKKLTNSKSELLFCPKCKKEYKEEFKFCSQDGTKLEKKKTIK